MTKKPIYTFEDTTSTGINEVPVGRIVYITATKEMFVLDNNTNLTPTSTIQDAINNGNLVLLSGGSCGQSQLYKYEFQAGSNQTTYNCIYNPDFLYVSVSGVDLAEAEFTATDGSTITLATAPEENEIVKVFSISNVLASSEIGNLKSDGTIPMDAGYTPSNDQDIATKVSVQEEVITRLEANVHFNLSIFGI